MRTISSTKNNRNWMLIIVSGIGATLALCLCVVAGLGFGGYFFYKQSGATTAQEPAVEYILDASPRMAQPTDGGTRLELARGILAEVIRPAASTTTAGLRVFGNGNVATVCQDTNLLVPLALSNQSRIAAAATEVEAGTQSDAAMAQAMITAIGDLATTKGPHTLVVITGGQDDCQAQAGDLIKAEAARAGITLEEFVVGFQLSAADSAAVKSLVAASSSGPVATYLDAPDAATLRNILAAIQAHVDQPVAVPIAVIQQAATSGAVISLPTLSAADTPVAVATNVKEGATAVGGTTSTPSTQFLAQTACDHPYMPLRPGATWTYASATGTDTWLVEDVSGDLNSAVATVLITMGDASLTYHWNCDSEGIRFNQAGLSGPGVSVVMDISNEKGVAIPALDKFVPGAAWEYAYTMSYSSQGIDMNTTVSESNVAGNIISVTNALGTFDTITVTSTESVSMDFADQTMNGTQTMQYGKGVGLMQTISTMAGHTNTYTLTSYRIP